MTARGMLGRDHLSGQRLLSQVGAGRRTPPRPALPSSTTAFVFQGGGSLAACQVGMLRALDEAGVVADLVVGSSAGALNAVAFASGPPSNLAALQSLWSLMRRRQVAPLSARPIVGALTGRSDGLVSDAGLRAVIKEHLPPRLEDTAILVHVVVTDFMSGEPVVISHGATVPALLASSAFPGLYPPVTISGRRLIDGGVSADMPVLQAEKLGATVTYVFPAAVADDHDAVHGPMAMAYRALGQILDAAARHDIAAARGRVHVLPAPTSSASNPVDFRDVARLIEDGYQLATRWLATARVFPGSRRAHHRPVRDACPPTPCPPTPCPPTPCPPTPCRHTPSAALVSSTG